jgi:hypothetical protein
MAKDDDDLLQLHGKVDVDKVTTTVDCVKLLKTTKLKFDATQKYIALTCKERQNRYYSLIRRISFKAWIEPIFGNGNTDLENQSSLSGCFYCQLCTYEICCNSEHDRCMMRFSFVSYNIILVSKSSQLDIIYLQYLACDLVTFKLKPL